MKNVRPVLWGSNSHLLCGQREQTFSRDYLFLEEINITIRRGKNAYFCVKDASSLRSFGLPAQDNLIIEAVIYLPAVVSEYNKVSFSATIASVSPRCFQFRRMSPRLHNNHYISDEPPFTLPSNHSIVSVRRKGVIEMDFAILNIFKWCKIYNMVEKVVTKHNVKDFNSIKEDLAYWLSKTPEERIEALELLRRQLHGSSERLQRTARVIQQT